MLQQDAGRDAQPAGTELDDAAATNPGSCSSFSDRELQSAVKRNGLKGKGALSKALVDRVRVNEV